jgi:hypothetical protein
LLRVVRVIIQGFCNSVMRAGSVEVDHEPTSRDEYREGAVELRTEKLSCTTPQFLNRFQSSERKCVTRERQDYC